MIKALIIDDEEKGALVLKLLLEKNCPDISVLAVEFGAEEGIEAIKQHKPDLVFLDIEMPTATGFDVLEATQHLKYEVIFITAYEQYAIQAIKAKAADYILKPVDAKELVTSVEEVSARILEKRKDKTEQLKEMVAEVLNKPKKISVPTTDGVIFIDVQDVIYLEAESNYTLIFQKDKSKIMASKTLKYFEEQLAGTNFLRVHAAHIVNLNEMHKYIKGDGGILVMKDGKNIPVSRANKQELLNRIGL